MKNDEIAKALERLTAIVEKMTPPIPAILPIPAIPSIPSIPAIPAIAAIVNSADHDLLVQVDIKVEGLIISVNRLAARDELYVLKDEFNFWRNILVSGLLLSIAAGVLMNLLVK